MRRASSRGTTLIEAMIALAILAIGILGLVRAVVYSAQSDRVARARTTASGYAMDLIPHLKALDFSHPLLAIGTHSDADITTNYPSYSGMRDGTLSALVGTDGKSFYDYGFTRTWEVVAAAAESVSDGGSKPANPSLRHVLIKVTYRDGLGGTATAEVDTSLHDRATLSAAFGAGGGQ